MHGRVKVKTTAEQQEAKRKEREKKLKLYTAAKEKIFTKRQNGEYDEEALRMTGEALTMNSDFYSLWNYRKEIYLKMKETRSADDLEAMFADELLFLEECLRRNPKSYGVWHHRCFVMDNTPRPDWKQELKLCNLFLDTDERNFHCWDYRRFVVKRSSVSAEDELQYTTDKICNNFSNFSSWHYRSKLLPVLHPDDSTSVGVEEGVLLNEYETVQNAFFTDPDDQSAWFYHRWLIGRGQKKIGVNCMFVTREEQLLMLTTTQPIKISPSSCEIFVTVNGVHPEGEWTDHKGNTDAFSHIWLFRSSDIDQLLPNGDLEIQVAVDSEEWGSSDTVMLPNIQSESWTLTQDDTGARFSHDMGAATSDTLQRELESIQELLELEPDNKWVLLTIVSLMKALDPVRYTTNVDSYIDKLQVIDATRWGYYEDLRSRFVIENYLEQFDFNSRVVSLAGQRLTQLFHQQLLAMVVTIDLSNNKLTHLKNFSCLQCVRELNLDDNKIQDVTELSYLRNLELLSVRNNLLSSVTCLKPLCSCSSLTTLNLHGNPMPTEDSSAKIVATVTQVRILDGTAVVKPL